MFNRSQNNIFNYETKQKFENIQKKLQKDRTPKDDMKALNDQSLTKNLNIEDPSKTEIQPLLNLYNQGQFKRALSQASKLFLNFPNSPVLYNIIGSVNHALHKTKEAMEAFNRAIEIKPDYPEAFNNMGISFKDQGKHEEALDTYNECIIIDPTYAEAHYNKGVIRIK